MVADATCLPFRAAIKRPCGRRTDSLSDAALALLSRCEFCAAATLT
jgi:hypothetical protein